MDYVNSGAKDGGTGKVCLPTISHSPRFVRSLEGSVKAILIEVSCRVNKLEKDFTFSKEIFFH